MVMMGVGSVMYKRHPLYKDYFFSTDGNCFSVARNRHEGIIKPAKDTKGYLRIGIGRKNSKSGRKETAKMHRLVLETFLGLSDLEVNHKNKARTDNRLDNLEYCDRTHNTRHIHYGNKRFVSRTKEGSFEVKLREGSKVLLRRRYKSEEEAYIAAHKKYTEHFGFEPWSK